MDGKLGIPGCRIESGMTARRPARVRKIGDKKQINVIEFKMLHARFADPSEGWTIS